jgi:hypothetical protein
MDDAVTGCLAVTVPSIRALRWLAALALLCMAQASADEASQLLGKAPISNAVRRMIDDKAVAPASRSSTGGPRISGDAQDDDDLPVANVPALDKLRLKKVKLKDGADSIAGGISQAMYPSPLDIHGGKLEAHSSSNVADGVAARLAATTASIDNIPGAHVVSINDPGAAVGNLKIKPAGFHVLDVVLDMQNPPNTNTSAASPGTEPDALRRLQNATTADSDAPVLKPGIKIPDNPLDRLKEIQTNLERIASILPPESRDIAAKVNQVIAPDFIAGIAKPKHEGPQASMAPNLRALADLQRLMPDKAMPPDKDATTHPVSPLRASIDDALTSTTDHDKGTQIKKPAGINQPDPDAIKKLAETNQPDPDAIKKPAGVDQPDPDAIKKLAETNQPDPDAIKKPAETNQPDPDAIKKSAGVDQPDPDAIKKLAETNQPDPDAIKKSAGIDQPDPDAIKKLAGVDQPDPDAIKKLAGVDQPNPDAIKKLAGINQPDPDAIKKSAGVDQPDPDAIKKLAETNQPDPDAIKKLAEINRPNASSVTDSLKEKLTASTSEVKGKIKDAIDNAFTQLKAACQTESDKHAASAATLNAQADGINPGRQYETHCEHTSFFYCGLSSPCDCSTNETAASVKANNDADAQKADLHTQADRETNQANQYDGAVGKLTLQNNDVDANLDTIFSDSDTKISQSDQSDGSGESGGDSGSGTPRTPTHPHGTSLADNNGVLLEHYLNITGDSIRTLSVTESVNAAIGMNAQVEQSLGAIGGGNGGKTFAGIKDTDITAGAVNAGIGSNSYARQVISSMGTVDDNQSVGSVTANRVVSLPINAAIGASSLADMRIASIGGSAQDVNMTSTVAAPVNAAIGYNTTALMEIGNIDGIVTKSATSTVVSGAPINAAIGAQTTSTIRIGNLGTEGSIGGSYTGSIVQPVGTVSVGIGYQTNSLVSLGNVDGTVGGDANVTIITGPVVSAAIGSNTYAINRVGELAKDVRVGGALNITSTTGLMTAFALGYATTASNEVAVIDAPVTGSATINVNVGEIVTGTIGANTAANAAIGSIKAPVYGDANISVTALGINTFAIGYSDVGAISSQTYIGNVLQPVYGPANINVVTGGVFTLGFGLVLDLGILGTLDFSRNGCTNIGNIGSGC